MNKLYIALVRAEEIVARGQWLTGQAIYYDPGSVSMDSNETLSYCFLEHRVDLFVVCSSWHCDLGQTLADQAIQLVDQERRRVDANLPEDWPQGIHPSMKTAAQKLYRLHYFLPEHSFVAGLLGRVQAGAVLTEKQLARVQQIYEERGGVEGLRRRQHAEWRLMRLAEIDLSRADRATVSKFRRYANSIDGLGKSKLPVITALEEKYWEQRRQATAKRAVQIGTLLR